MPEAPDPLSELSALMGRSRQLLGELRVLEERLEKVASRIAQLSLPTHSAPAESDLIAERAGRLRIGTA